MFVHQLSKEKIFLLCEAVLGIYIIDSIFSFALELTNSSYYFSYIIPKTIIFGIITSLYVLIMYEFLQKRISFIGFIPVILSILTIFSCMLFQPPTTVNFIFNFVRPLAIIGICFIYFFHLNKEIKSGKYSINIKIVIFVLFTMCVSLIESFISFVNNQTILQHYSRFFQKTLLSEDIFSFLIAAIILVYCKRFAKEDKNQTVAVTNTKDYAIQQDTQKKFLNENIARLECEYDLTNREKEILYLILKGESNQEIADNLHIAVGTVKTHVHNIYKKLNITKRSQLMSYCMNLVK